MAGAHIPFFGLTRGTWYEVRWIYGRADSDDPSEGGKHADVFLDPEDAHRRAREIEAIARSKPGRAARVHVIKITAEPAASQAPR